MKTITYSLMYLGLAVCTTQTTAAPMQHVLRPDISVDAARRVIDATLDNCHAKGKTLAAALVDSGGNLIVLQRDDDVGPHNTMAAQRKAYTALSTKTATAQLAENARSAAQTSNLNTVGELLLLGGGVPIKSGNAVIGALGVAGAGGPAMDESRAVAGINAVFPSPIN